MPIYEVNYESKIIDNSGAKHKGNHIIFICDKRHVDFHKLSGITQRLF